MIRRYNTTKGGLYIQRIKGGVEFWARREENGDIRPLVGGIHISRKVLKELIKEYPSTLLDKTYSFDTDVEKEFFEDAKRESFTGDIQKEDTVIFFLVKRGPDRFGIGLSSKIERIEELK
ncbi:MAG: hypothetical protein ACYTBP_03390 [Planctomycetota bacterium]|jgi:hypothetical protein